MSQYCAVDTETEKIREGFNPVVYTPALLGVSVSHDGIEGEYSEDQAKWPSMMPDTTVVFHNAKYDLAVLEAAGLPIPEQWEDTLIAAHLIDENGEHGLKPLAEKLLGIENPLSFEEADRMRWFDPNIFYEYATNDAKYTRRLWDLFKVQLEEQGLMPVYEREKALLPVVMAMERAGMKVDVSQINQLKAEVVEEISKLESQIYDQAGMKFDLRSPAKLAGILYGYLNLECAYSTKNGNASTGTTALEEIKGDHPIVPLIIEYRELDKLLSSFLNALPRYVDANNRLHPSFNQLGTTSGRFSASNVNVQQIPSRSEVGKKIRSMFVPEPGYVLVVADYGQQELRLLAHYSQDKTLLEVYDSDEQIDLHRLTASKMFNKPLDQVTKQERSVGKTLNFGIAYGIGPKGLRNQLHAAGIDVSEDEAQKFLDGFFAAYPGVKWLQTKVEQTVKIRGWIKNLYGRRRRAIRSQDEKGNKFIRRGQIRSIQNFLIQSMGAELTKDSMIALHDKLPEGARLIACIHDELIVECRREDAESVKELMVDVMVHPNVELKVKLTVDVHIVNSWGEAK